MRGKAFTGPFDSVLVALLLTQAHANCQEAAKPADVLAAELAKRQICESYLGRPPSSPVVCEWPNSRLEAHLALLTRVPQSLQTTRSRLQGVIFRLNASLTQDGYWKTTLSFWSKETEAAAKSGLRPLQDGAETRTLTATAAAEGNRKEQFAATAEQIKSLPEFADLSERELKIKRIILEQLNLQPELLRPFLDRAPLSKELIAVRTYLAAGAITK